MGNLRRAVLSGRMPSGPQRAREQNARLVSDAPARYIAPRSPLTQTAFPKDPPSLTTRARLSEHLSAFSYSCSPEPHRDRTKQILRRHPEIRNLIGPSPVTFWCILGLVSLQFGIAWFVADRSIWLVLALAYTVGAFASHGLFVMIHECAHRLVFRRRMPNVLTGHGRQSSALCAGLLLLPEVPPQAPRAIRASTSSMPTYRASGRLGWSAARPCGRRSG